MALNPAFADASVNPSQSMGNDASVNPTQGALPTANQPQYTSPLNQPSAPDVSENAYQLYTGQQSESGGAAQPYGDWANSQVYGGPPTNYQPSPPPFMPQGNMPQIGQPLGQFNPATTLPDGTRNSEGGSYEYPQDPPSRYTYFGDDKADYSQLGLSQSALDSLNMMRQAPDMGQFYYDTQTKTFGQGMGHPPPNIPGQRRYTGKTGIPLELMNKLGGGEYVDFSKYAQYTEGTPVIQPQDVAQLPEQQPQVLGTQVPYEDPRATIGPTLTQRNPLTPTATPTGTPTNLPTGWKSNPVNALFQGDLPGRIYRQADGSYLDESGKPADMNNYQIPRQPTATPTGTTPMATNPLSQVPVDPAAAYTPAPNVGTASSGGGSFTQGAPLPNITTTQQQVTAAPEFYTDYLNQLAKQGASTAQNAQYVGATDLQNQAFNQTAQNVGNYQPTLQSAINMAQNVGDSNLYKAVGELGQANIARNLAPQATAGIVGSGQFGSKRGAAALGDTIANAELGITAQQAQALQQDMQNRIAAAQQLGNLASTTQQLGLGDINALATMGGQKQTIAQNEQLFPMQQLTNQSQLLRGYTIPTSTGSSYTGPIPGAYAASPLQQIAGLGALGAGISNTPLGSALFGTSPTIDPKTGLVINPGTSGIIGKGVDALTGGAKDLFSYLNKPGTNETNLPPITTPGGGTATPNGDGSYTTPDGRIVGVDGNPIPGYVYPDPGGNNETPFPGNFDYNDTTPPIPTNETYNSWFGD